MAQLQYIGARYVPIWYQNSVDGTANWEINVEYEPLTWVTTQNNHLYLSKKTVPDNIGTPAQNTDYWLDMGVITGNVQDIQDQIDAIVANMGSLSDLDTVDKSSLVAAINEVAAGGGGGGGTLARKIYFLGDSYGETYTSGGTTITGWLDKMQAVLGSSITVDSRSESLSGYGFLSNGTGHQWIERINLISGTDDTVTDVCFIGGHNDAAYAATNPNLSSTIMSTIAAAKTKFPKAKIWVGFCSIAIGDNEATIATYNTYCSGGSAEGAAIMDDSLAWCLFDSDLWFNVNHPNNAGTTVMARAISTILKGGKFFNGYTKVAHKVVDASVEASTIPDIYIEVVGGQLILRSPITNNSMSAFLFATGVNKAADGSQAIILAKYDNMPINYGPVNLGVLPCLTVYSTAGYNMGTAQLFYENGFLKARIISLHNGDYINQAHNQTLTRLIFAGINLRINLIRNAAD